MTTPNYYRQRTRFTPEEFFVSRFSNGLERPESALLRYRELHAEVLAAFVADTTADSRIRDALNVVEFMQARKLDPREHDDQVHNAYLDRLLWEWKQDPNLPAIVEVVRKHVRTFRHHR